MKRETRILKKTEILQVLLSCFLGCVCFIIFLWGCVDSQAPDDTENIGVYYVSPIGDDANAGTRELPWQTIQKAAETLVAGETVMIMAGTYRERIDPRNSGSPDKYISYQAYQGENVVIDGLDVFVPEWGGLFDIMNKSYIRISGLTVVNALSCPHNIGIQVDHSDHIILEQNRIRHTNDSGIGVWNSINVCVDGNEVSEVCLSGWNECITVGGTDTFEIKGNLVQHSQKEGICSKDGSRNGKILGNRVVGVFSVGIYLDAWNKHTFSIEVYQNVVHDTVEGNGLSLASEMGGELENISVYNNLFYHNQYVGIHISTNGIFTTHPMKNIRIINNTCSGNGWIDWGGGISMDNIDAREVVIRNNICSNNRYFQIAVILGAPAAAVDHNLVHPFLGTENEITGGSPVTGDPEFVDGDAFDFHLQSFSPAIDQGSADGSPVLDFDGIPRPQGKDFDIGAFEFK
jgi:hypothetical protein